MLPSGSKSSSTSFPSTTLPSSTVIKYEADEQVDIQLEFKQEPTVKEQQEEEANVLQFHSKLSNKLDACPNENEMKYKVKEENPKEGARTSTTSGKLEFKRLEQDNQSALDEAFVENLRKSLNPPNTEDLSIVLRRVDSVLRERINPKTGEREFLVKWERSWVDDAFATKNCPEKVREFKARRAADLAEARAAAKRAAESQISIPAGQQQQQQQQREPEREKLPSNNTVCQECVVPRRFKSTSNLNRHIRQTHGEMSLEGPHKTHKGVCGKKRKMQ